MDASHIGTGHDDAGATNDDDSVGDGDGDGDGQPGDDSTPGDGDGDGDPSMDAGPPDSGAPPANEDSGPPPSFTPDPGQVGAPCMNDNECDGFNAACATERNNIELPGGYCTHGCLGVCGANERCTSEDFCVRTCSSDADCRAAEGYECRDQTCTLPGL
jgi:hypothetical protein